MRCFKAFLTEQEIYIVPNISSAFPFLVVPVLQKCCELKMPHAVNQSIDVKEWNLWHTKNCTGT
jgi:hypothetical protein